MEDKFHIPKEGGDVELTFFDQVQTGCKRLEREKWISEMFGLSIRDEYDRCLLMTLFQGLVRSLFDHGRQHR